MRVGKVSTAATLFPAPMLTEVDFTGTFENPITVKAFGEEQYLGCTGSPADSHVTIWLVTSRDRPHERCPECGSVYKLEYVGPPDDHGHGHGHDAHGEEHHHWEGEPKTIADFVKPEYRYM